MRASAYRSTHDLGPENEISERVMRGCRGRAVLEKPWAIP
jgi:hypothetical protein